MLDPSCPAVARLAFSRGITERSPQRHLLLRPSDQALHIDQVSISILRRGIGRAITPVFQARLQTGCLTVKLTPLLDERCRVLSQRFGYSPVLKPMLCSLQYPLRKLVPQQLCHLFSALQEVLKQRRN
jgi:hypothetical protein